MVRLLWPGWWLGLVVGAGPPLMAQVRDSVPAVELKENYPNPFYPSTTIPFEIHPEVCSRGNHPLVRLEILNVIAQVVAVPLVGENLPQRLDGIRLGCGSYKAYWDGKYLDGQREVTTGVYWCRLIVDGRPYTRRMIVQRRFPGITGSH